MSEKRVALIIASYQYEDTDLRQLVAPAQDAEALSQVLEDPAIGVFQVQMLLNEPSYKVNQEIEAFFADRKRDDLLLLYFSGHGIKDEEGRLYFATADTQRKLLRSTAVWANFVNDTMRCSRSRRQVLLLDCCYSGAFARGMVAKADKDIGTKEYFKGRGRVVLTASDAMQYSFEGGEIAGEGVRSVFTRTLVRGLKTGEADVNGDGYITIDELYNYVHDRVIDETPQQRPGKWAFGVQGEIIIARNPRPDIKPAKLTMELQQATESPAATAREGTVLERGDRLAQLENSYPVSLLKVTAALARRIKRNTFALVLLLFICVGLESLEIVRNVGWFLVRYPQVNWWGLLVPLSFGLITLVLFLSFEHRMFQSLWLFITLPLLGVTLVFTLYKPGLIIPTLYAGFGILGGVLANTHGVASFHERLGQLGKETEEADPKLRVLADETINLFNVLVAFSVALAIVFIGLGAILYMAPNLANMQDPVVRNVRAMELLTAALFVYVAILAYGAIPLWRIRQRCLQLLLRPKTNAPKGAFR